MKKIKEVNIGSVKIGGGNPVAVQSMCFSPTNDVSKVTAEIKLQESFGCAITRVAIRDMDDVRTIPKIMEQINIPLVADIHFDYKLAVESAYAGISKVRINPGNIGDESKVKAVCDACRLHNIPIRIGANSGSIDKDILKKYGRPSAQAMVESALKRIEELNRFDFDDIVIALKSSNVKDTIEAYTLMSEKTNYPLHIGATEVGDSFFGLIKQTASIASLLVNGIGDTLRVSLSDTTDKEVIAGYEILRACGLYDGGVDMISCPTCARCGYDVFEAAREVKERLKHVKEPLKVAVMGCAVNGPGEAR